MISIILTAIYFIVCLIVGIYRIPVMKTLKEYSLGVQAFPLGILVATMFATAIGPGETMGRAEKAMALGLVFILPTLLEPFRWWIMGKLLAPNNKLFKKEGCITLGDMFEVFFGKAGRWVCVSLVLLNIGVLSIMYKGMAYTLHYFLGLDETWGIIIGALVVGFYSISGGIHSVALTDTIQFLIFFIVFPIVFIIGYKNSGGITNIIPLIPQDKMSFLSPDKIGLFISLIIYNIIPCTGMPFLQRALMAQNSQQVKKLYYTTAVISFPFTAIMCIIGFIVAGIAPSSDPNMALFTFVDNYLPSSVNVFIALSLLAVIMSTASSFLNTSSIVVVNDIIKQFNPKLVEDKSIMLLRVTGFITVILSVAFSFSKGSIVDLLWSMDNFWDPLISIPLLLGLIGIRTTSKNFYLAVFSTIAVILAARLFHGEFDTITLSVGVITSALFIIVMKKNKSTVTQEVLS